MEKNRVLNHSVTHRAYLTTPRKPKRLQFGITYLLGYEEVLMGAVLLVLTIGMRAFKRVNDNESFKRLRN